MNNEKWKDNRMLCDCNYSNFDIRNIFKQKKGRRCMNKNVRLCKIHTKKFTKDKGYCLIHGGKIKLNQKYVKQTHSFICFLSSFMISKYLVTQKEWTDLMGYNPSLFIGEMYPVHGITWYEALKFCNKKSTLHGLELCYSENFKCDFTKNGYRLPTECEWEYAARGGKHSCINTNIIKNMDLFAWYDHNSKGRIHNIAQKLPNPLGIFDMSGNVWEWCWDWYKEYPYSFKTNYKGPDKGHYKVCRGGCWAVESEICSPTYRNDVDPMSSSEYGIGLRLVKKI